MRKAAVSAKTEQRIPGETKSRKNVNLPIKVVFGGVLFETYHFGPDRRFEGGKRIGRGHLWKFGPRGRDFGNLAALSSPEEIPLVPSGVGGNTGIYQQGIFFGFQSFTTVAAHQ